MDLIQDKIDKYESAVTYLVEYFCIKQGLEFNFWVADKIGEMAVCSDYYFAFSDIKFDMETGQRIDKIIDWYNETVEFGMDNEHNGESINYETYCKGFTYVDLAKSKLDLQKSIKDLEA